MNADEFNSISKKSDKEIKIKSLNSEEIAKLIESQKTGVYREWDNCVTITGRKISLEPVDEEEKVLYHDDILSRAKWSSKKFGYRTTCCAIPISQWDIFNCELGYNIGFEENKTRPVLIIQKVLNYTSASTVIIAPITTSPKHKGLRHEIVLPESQTHKGIYGVIDLSQIRTVSKLRLSNNRIDFLKCKEEYGAYCKKSAIDFHEDDLVIYKVKRELTRLFNITQIV